MNMAPDRGIKSYESAPATFARPGAWPDLVRRSSVLKGTCSVEGCSAAVQARGLCNSHYGRWHRHGDPTAGNPPNAPAIVRFWRHVNKDGTVPSYAPHLGQCWEWTASGVRGYGTLGDDSERKVLAHRFIYELEVGAIPDRYEVDHLCRNRACVNPAHLEAVTKSENLRRNAEAMGRAIHCKRGHPFDAENTIVGRRGSRECRICCRTGQRRRRREATLERQRLALIDAARRDRNAA